MLFIVRWLSALVILSAIRRQRVITYTWPLTKLQGADGHSDSADSVITFCERQMLPKFSSCRLLLCAVCDCIPLSADIVALRHVITSYARTMVSPLVTSKDFSNSSWFLSLHHGIMVASVDLACGLSTPWKISTPQHWMLLVVRREFYYQ